MTWRVPEIADCDGHGVEPTGFMVLVAMAEKERVTAGGIHLPESVASKEEWAREKGRLVAVSPLAFTYAKWPEGARVPAVGDVIYCGRYAGKTIEGRNGRQYQLMTDQDIGAVLERGDG